MASHGNVFGSGCAGLGLRRQRAGIITGFGQGVRNAR